MLFSTGFNLVYCALALSHAGSLALISVERARMYVCAVIASHSYTLALALLSLEFPSPFLKKKKNLGIIKICIHTNTQTYHSLTGVPFGAYKIAVRASICVRACVCALIQLSKWVADCCFALFLPFRS